MKSERETLEKLEEMSHVQMSSHKQQEVWDDIVKEIDDMKPERIKRHSGVWGTSAAAAAAVAVLAGGFYAFTNHGGTTTKIYPGSTTATNGTSTASNSLVFPTQSEIQSVVIWGGAGPTEDWNAQNPHAVETKVLGWLKSSTLYNGNIPKAQTSENGVTTPYRGSAQLILKLANRTINITPTYYEPTGQNGQVQVRYINNVVTYSDSVHNGSKPIYLHSPTLFTWLKENQWKTEFASPTTTTNKVSLMQGFLLYRNAIYKFSVQYPKTWTQLPKGMDGSGSTFILDTKIRNFANQLGWSNIPSQAAVINAIGAYNVTNLTYAKVKTQPKDTSITSYSISKYGDGYEIHEEQKRSAFWYTVQFFDKTYIKTLQVIIPDQKNYKQLASEVIKSYNPVS